MNRSAAMRAVMTSRYSRTLSIANPQTDDTESNAEPIAAQTSSRT
ncbi:MAG: hypothetical protein ABUL60_08010 [Myxococcales bacterium]